MKMLEGTMEYSREAKVGATVLGSGAITRDWHRL